MADVDDTKTVAVLGLGNMGSALAEALPCGIGHPLNGFCTRRGTPVGWVFSHRVESDTH